MRSTFFGWFLLFLVGCASSPDGIRPKPPPGTLTEEEIQGTGATNLHEALEKIRPGWLAQSRPESVDIVGPALNRLGTGAHSLYTMTLDGVYKMEMMSGSDLRHRLSSRRGGGLIVVYRR